MDKAMKKQADGVSQELRKKKGLCGKPLLIRQWIKKLRRRPLQK